MNELRRITPDEAEAAYKATGLRPTQGLTLDKIDGCACPIGAVAAITRSDLESSVSLGEAVEVLKLDDFYAAGFAQAFDEGTPNGLGHPRYSVGFRDGQAVKARVLPT